MHSRKNDPDHQRLIRLARTQICPDPAVAQCWYYVRYALDDGFFGASSLERVAQGIESGSGFGADEFSIDVEGDEAVVNYQGDTCNCPRAGLVTALRELHQRYLLGPAYEFSEEAAWAASRPPPDEAKIQEVLRLLFLFLGGLDPKSAPQDMSKLSPELRARFEQVKELVRRMRVAPHMVDAHAAAKEVPRLSPQVEALIGPLFQRLSEVYRDETQRNPEAVADWVGILGPWLAGDSAAGAKLDELINKLEEKAGPLLQPPGQTPAQKDEALQTRVRSSIWEALKKRGFSED